MVCRPTVIEKNMTWIFTFLIKSQCLSPNSKEYFFMSYQQLVEAFIVWGVVYTTVYMTASPSGGQVIQNTQ
jgi:hypothetical protein